MNEFEQCELIRFKSMVKAYQDVLDNLCRRELIPEGRDYVIKQRDRYQELINKLENGKNQQ